MFSTVQQAVALVLGVGALGLEGFALVDALRRRPDAFVAAGKKTKQFWTVLLGACAGIGIVVLFMPLTLFGLIAVVAAAVYLTDVRPALDEVQGRGGRMGPYGPW
ncbi:MAG: DUF2516 family protein [Tetrasphaera sp.]|jgi:hypothetical protein|nr:DUF2516 family protein [Tetrasphaera sp.]